MALSTREDTPRPVLGATRARQGRFGRHIFWVLVFGTLLAALALFAAWTWRSGDLEAGDRTPQVRAAGSQTFDAPAPDSVSRQAPPPN